MKHLYSYNYSLGFRNFLVTNIDDFSLLRSSDLFANSINAEGFICLAYHPLYVSGN